MNLLCQFHTHPIQHLVKGFQGNALLLICRLLHPYAISKNRQAAISLLIHHNIIRAYPTFQSNSTLHNQRKGQILCILLVNGCYAHYFLLTKSRPFLHLIMMNLATFIPAYSIDSYVRLPI